jgi:SNF2 family DNA or RNA helicase
MILDALLKLRQVCCHPQLLKVDAAKAVKESAKLEALMELVEPLVAEGRRMLVFSQFVEMLQVIRERLKASGIEPLLLTGQTKKRGALVEEFQKGASPVFLISLKAGGTGLNLTAADTVIHYDPWWNPAAEAQATDRAHRMGQRSTVFVHKLICEGTIEERILELQQRKAALVAGLLDASAPAVSLTAEDLEMLLSPIG